MSTAATVATTLRQLSGVTPKTEFGGLAFFVGGTRFAALTPEAVLLHLPPEALTEALMGGAARPFISVGAMGKHGWVEIRFSSIGPDELSRYLLAAHNAALHGHRRTAMKKPGRARHTRKTTPK
ncbi:MAG: MmcQ/YjbR family DNA-binding protein [Gemmatimonadetes bacterium]|nr:MmcQ/YjbR family DNA-binding protein [Gemmatimonadota bacterium]